MLYVASHVQYRLEIGGSTLVDDIKVVECIWYHTPWTQGFCEVKVMDQFDWHESTCVEFLGIDV